MQNYTNTTQNSITPNGFNKFLIITTNANQEICHNYMFIYENTSLLLLGLRITQFLKPHNNKLVNIINLSTNAKLYQ